MKKWMIFLVFILHLFSMTFAITKKQIIPDPNININSVKYMEFNFGSITTHFPFDFVGAPDKFINKISPEGWIIFNPLFGLKLTVELIDPKNIYLSFMTYFGANSVGNVMGGLIGSVGAKLLADHLYLGVIAGGYIQPAGTSSYFTINSSVTVIPLLGFEVLLKFKIGNHLILSFNNILTPIIISTSASIGFKL